ncbi:hypothetical protein [Paenibacillus gansuensis]|uniref:Uncharacterized protein n=1 Tax=Paenibacillus gansuensis TaxID=306542 RepID=A0ABW5PI49_9BACL
MIYIISALLVVVTTLIILIKLNFKYSFSIAAGASFMFTLIASISLSQNYTYNLIPKLNDGGIAISNRLAYLIIGEDRWSIDKFKWYFETSITLSLLIIQLLISCLLYEVRRGELKQNNITTPR